MTQVLEQIKQPIKVSAIEKGDVFSEISHYIFEEKKGNSFTFKHQESGKLVTLDTKYVAELLSTGDQYEKEVKVGREDKYWTEEQIVEARAKGIIDINSSIRKGDLKLAGIRTIFENIFSSEVFSISYTKQDKPLSDKKYKELKAKQAKEAAEKINAISIKDNIIDSIQKIVTNIQENPVLAVEPGEERILRGYKIQFKSRDGRYDCFDMDFPGGEKGSNIRPVNINTINWLTFKGVRYVVE